MKRIQSLLLVLVLTTVFLCPAASSLVPAARSEEMMIDAQTLGREVAADASGVWQIVDQEIRCSDPETGALLAALPLGDLNMGLPYRFSLLSDGETVRLCLASQDARGEIRVALLTLALASGKIQVLRSQDCTAELGEIYTPNGSALQTDMVSCAQGIALSVLDEQFDCHLLLFDPESGDLTELGQMPFSILTALCPKGTRLLLAGDSMDVDHALFLAELSPAEGDLVWTADLPVGIGVSGQNYVYDPDSGFLYFTLQNAAWRVKPESGAAPEPVAVFSGMPGEFGNGTLAGNRYLVQTEEGELLSCDVSSALAVPRVRIADLTGSESALTAAALVNAAQSEAFLTVEATEAEEEEELDLSAFDAAVLPLSGEEGQALLHRGDLLDLSGSGILSAAVSAMPEGLRGALQAGEKLVAFPVAAASPCLTLNTAALRELTGMEAEALPHDWEGLLKLLAGLADSGALTGQDRWSMTEAGFTAEDFRQAMLIWLLRTAVLEAQRDGIAPRAFQESLAGLLHAWEGVRWERLGLPTDEETMIQTDASSDGAPAETAALPIVSEQLFEISPMHMEENVSCWPLSPRAGEEPLLPWQVSVLVIRADSPAAQLLLKWAETLWDQTDVLVKMSLTPGMDEPIGNPDYEEAVAYYENRIQADEQALAFAAGEEAEMLQEELSQLRPFLEAYRENALWRASADSIAAYRRLSLVPETTAFWETAEGIEQLNRYLAGDATAEELAAWFGGR